jgi:glutathione S-transferase
MDDFDLYQFKRSHYNEKARWALDYKRLPHTRHSLLPGPHKLTVTRLSGQAQVPVLRHGRKIIAGSARIIDYLEQLVPEPALYPPEGPTYPEPRAAVALRWAARWADHPGADWVRGIYRRHRGESAEVRV